MNELPELTVTARGNSGIEIQAKMPEKFNLGEYTLRDDIPISVFISPWWQFEPARMNELRLKMAYEIVRRTLAYDELVKQVEYMQKRLDSDREYYDGQIEHYIGMIKDLKNLDNH